ncbi:MAG TPA: NAD(P)(+) transhydrogenase (Re/Si-specific) subunit alpha [Desulfobacteraceae bacterium]|nr:NAD(P)(+) transhydrogenase (Re/Si-specific) subunit alpha [Desulfobacteraceae bacterium]
MRIGIPKEIKKNEKRVAALPETVRKIKKLGFDVFVESKAGHGAFVSDYDYEKAGATIVDDAHQVYGICDTILKVIEPLFNERLNAHEIDLLKENQILITFLHPAAPLSHPSVTRLMEKKVTAFTMDGIPRISRAKRMDPLASMSAIAGYKSVMIAASHFSGVIPMMGTSIGMTKPANVLVVGTGVVGLQAAATAKRLGGLVKSVDIRPDAKKEAESLGVKVTGFEVPWEIAVGQGGYAKALSKEWLELERSALTPQVAEADIVILSAQVPGEAAPILITKKMVESMKPGSVIIDVPIDQGGNCEITVPAKQTVHQGVHISGIKNIPGLQPVHSSWLYANNLYYFIENLFKVRIGDGFDMRDEIIRKSLVTYGGKLFHEGTRKAMGLAGNTGIT